ncbi:MAG: GNAT family N-acetyltransferase [Acidimicrobiales bacterium]
MEPVVEAAPAAAVRPLRHAVLRPHQRPEELVYPGDDDPAAGHFVARDAGGEVVGAASVVPEPPPWDPARADAWRLRGMATAPGRRGQGIGARLLAAATAHAAVNGCRLLWCNARLPAVAFYERAGMAVRGTPFEEAGIGPHVAMWRTVGPG